MPAMRTPSRTRELGIPYEPRINVGFRRVTARSPCPICKRTKWCQVTRDGKLAHCMWEAIGSVKRAKDDGYIHVLIDDELHTPHTSTHHMTSHNHPASSADLAPLEIRDRVYRRLIELSPAWKYERELVTAPRGLLARGFSQNDIRRFGALPARAAERDALARKINAELEADLPVYAATVRGATVLGVRGFWEGANGVPKLGRATSYQRPALIIPYRDCEGSIQACQLRFSDKRDKSSYSWLSTAEDKFAAEPRGTSSGSPLHFAMCEGQYLPDLPVLVTEGALKAEAFIVQRPAMRAIATAGVSVAHAELIAATRGQDVAIGFDIDHRQNEKVCRQLAKLIAEREQDAVSAGHKTTTSIVIWDGPKGIDDVALANVHLRVVSVAQWCRTLTGKPLEEVKDVWCQMHYNVKI
ncbi:MAG: hypothetical protein M3371_15440 [Acidobacteriota bacterium]|nr:hypothetical protein [Acidobacteriota bacterium]